MHVQIMDLDRSAMSQKSATLIAEKVFLVNFMACRIFQMIIDGRFFLRFALKLQNYKRYYFHYGSACFS